MPVIPKITMTTYFRYRHSAALAAEAAILSIDLRGTSAKLWRGAKITDIIIYIVCQSHAISIVVDPALLQTPATARNALHAHQPKRIVVHEECLERGLIPAGAFDPRVRNSHFISPPDLQESQRSNAVTRTLQLHMRDVLTNACSFSKN